MALVASSSLVGAGCASTDHRAGVHTGIHRTTVGTVGCPFLDSVGEAVVSFGSGPSWLLYTEHCGTIADSIHTGVGTWDLAAPDRAVPAGISSTQVPILPGPENAARCCSRSPVVRGATAAPEYLRRGQPGGEPGELLVQRQDGRIVGDIRLAP